MAPRPTDLLVHGHYSIHLLHGASPRGQQWLDEHISEDHQKWAGAIVIEHRFIGDIIRGAIADGLRVRLCSRNVSGTSLIEDASN